MPGIGRRFNPQSTRSARLGILHSATDVRLTVSALTAF